jgi:hypothetical protein
MNPDWEIRFLSREDLSEHFDLDVLTDGAIDRMSPQNVANLVRINLLKRHGGVWADATCLCMVPLDDWIHEYAKSGFFAFSKPRPDRLMSNWFLAAEEDCPLVSRLCSVVNSYCAANDFTGPKNRFSRYVARKARQYIDDDPWLSAVYASPLFARFIGYTPYFWFHYSFAYTLLTSRSARQIWSDTPEVSSDFSAGDGPHAIQSHGMFENISDSLKTRILTREDPMYKLDWKKSAEQDFALSDADSQHAVKYAMQEAGIQPMAN